MALYIFFLCVFILIDNSFIKTRSKRSTEQVQFKKYSICVLLQPFHLHKPVQTAICDWTFVIAVVCGDQEGEDDTILLRPNFLK